MKSAREEVKRYLIAPHVTTGGGGPACSRALVPLRFGSGHEPREAAAAAEWPASGV